MGVSLTKPLPKRILVSEVAVCCFADDCWRLQAEALPFQTAVNAPAQDGRPFGLELGPQVWISLGGRDLHRKGHQQQAPLHGLIYGIEPWLVIAGDEQLEGG